MRLAPTPRWTDAVTSLFLLTPDRVSDAYLGWLADPEVNRYLEVRFSPQGRAEAEAFVAAMLDSERDLLFGIHSIALGRHVGNIKLGPIDRNHGLGEIGIMVGDRSAWGQGIAPSAIRRVTAIAKSELGLRRLSAGCYASNVGSRKAFEKAGFAVEAMRPQHYLLDGKAEDALLLGKIIQESEAA
ncbi:MAG TPA: GNAT family N-acetyltransferase [Allosphingosinicella sp.]|nr:GNAT family N-acetyltransferase [Allosphingosinicella sp.]